jgi:phage terminase Nu1 subunit (DNA packaging protein)
MKAKPKKARNAQGKRADLDKGQASRAPAVVNAPALVSEILDKRLLLPQKICAMVFDISPQAIQQWPIKPVTKTGRISLYYLPDLARYRDQQIDDGRALNLQAERARLACAQADRVELEVQQLTGELIPADVILANWEPIVGAARAKVLGLPSKLKTAIPKLTDADLKKVKTIVRGVLEDLANNGIPKSARPDTRPHL